MAKMGRPKSENPKQNILTMRVTDQERDEFCSMGSDYWKIRRHRNHCYDFEVLP